MEHGRNHSKKRDAILELLQGDHGHPGAEEIYQRLKPRFPDLSLGTVYRNLAVCEEEGLLTSVGIVNGQERFDGTLSPHSHFICERCGAVLDLPAFTLPEQWQKEIEAAGNMPHSWNLRFSGICKACREKEAENTP